ncbi:hypothetical protein ENSA5_18640 [Enhygromyxa salina]|uniref:Tetratricopeptide repeat protein n=1 Tax=Enhygromyxa salina TaxID=215803 RepID=A0A2S9YCU7_9BACT|nr:hypothetical protein [Enhygromyxa salina]PRQ02925.1 hypothetical protein ENSA5_18640 [Enhygromyxa salina]
MSSRLNRFGGGSALALAAALVLGGPLGCSPETDAPEPSALDTRLEAHAVLSGAPTPAGLDYVRAVAHAHRQADESSDPRAALDVLLAALDRSPPANDGTAELLHYELLARSGELLLTLKDHGRARQLLEPRLATELSLPIDRASARCLVALGDAAANTGDHALAMSSYTRALEMLTLLLEEVES